MITAIVWLVYATLGAIYNAASEETALPRGELLFRGALVFVSATAAAILATIVVNR